MMERPGLSQQHPLPLLGIDRPTLRYQGKPPDDGAPRQRLRELAAERRRFGYRRTRLDAGPRSQALNHKRLYRVYREEKPMVPVTFSGSTIPLPCGQSDVACWDG
jgi:putative transposase